MATIASSAKTTYVGGTVESSSQIVGYSGKNRVVRFEFTTDAIGASSVAWSLTGNYAGEGTLPALRWYIGTSATSHANAGASTTTYNGAVTATKEDGAYTFSGSADIVLLPNTTYYLWLFPATTQSGYYNLTEKRQANLTTEGGAGQVYIKNVSGRDPYQAFISNGTSLELYQAFVSNGTSLDMCN